MYYFKMRWLVVLGIIAVTLSAKIPFNISFNTLPVFYHLSFSFGLQSIDVFMEQEISQG